MFFLDNFVNVAHDFRNNLLKTDIVEIDGIAANPLLSNHFLLKQGFYQAKSSIFIRPKAVILILSYCNKKTPNVQFEPTEFL